jgi:hypothetical protein
MATISKKEQKTVSKKKVKKKPVGSCFILMPFKEPFNTYYNSIIKPAVVAANLDPLRGDSLFRPSPIMGDVWTMIQEAKVLVAELTEKNANVFYELGLSHAIGKPVILLSETIDDVPFDLQPLRVVLYNKNHPAWGNKLRTTLIASLEETLSDSVGAVPPMFRKAVKSQAPGESETTLRLSALERQIAALRDKDLSPAGAIEVGPTPISLSMVRNDLMHAKSIKDSVEILERWMRRGLSPNLARKMIMDTMPKDRARALLRYFSLRF